MSNFSIESRNRISRKPIRGHYDRETIYQIIDQTKICHVGFISDGQPFVIPTLHARQEDHLLLHGAVNSRLILHILAGNEICINMVILDAFVLAKTVLNHSINYKSVVIFGKGYEIGDESEKMAALECLTEHLTPGRWNDARKPSPAEMAATTVVGIKLESASAKIRSGPPMDDGEDQNLNVWAGILPIRQAIGQPEPASYCGENNVVPAYLETY